MSKGNYALKNGSRIAIIGGGPAGSFFALYLLKCAGERGIPPEITIYQEREFNALGPKGCKGCAGIPSLNLTRNLDDLHLNMPEQIVQARIERYSVHSPYTSISISNPEKGRAIVSVYRGGGPRISHFENPMSFDGWLLEQAQKQDVKIENQRVSGIDLEQGIIVEVSGTKLEYDLIVLATGVNAKTIPVLGIGYIPPKTRTMVVVELYAGTDEVQSRLGNAAHAFMIPHSGLIFGTLVPKGPFINVALLYNGKHTMSIDDFLKHELVQSVLPGQYERACACRPRAAVSCAHNYYADRFVAIGDAAATRLYKDGIGFASLTAREAARTAVYHGISYQDFKSHYEPFCKAINRDNQWGRIVFSLNDKAKNSPTFLLSQHRLIADEQDNMRGPRPFTKAAWGMFTGGYSYSSIVKMALSPVSLAKGYLSLFRESIRRSFHNKDTYPKRLHIGSKKVLILGSGFGGTYTLRHLVRSLNQNENVETTMISDENFFLFAPLLHEVALGGIETRHIAYPIRRLHWRDRFNFVQASVQKIDLIGRKVNTTGGTFDFDYLILALGSVVDISALKHSGASPFTLKTLRDSMMIRNHIIGVFEKASVVKDVERQKQQLTFVVSGAGYVGVQVVTELRDLIHKSLLRYYRTIDPTKIRIILVDTEPRIIAHLHTKLGAYATKQLQHMNIEVRLKSRITRVWEDRMEINDAEIVPTVTTIWATGALANPRVAELGVKKDSIGRVSVNEYLEIPGFPGVFAIGDCTHFEDPVSGQAIPPRAHTTVRQAKVAAHNILAEIRGRERKPYRYSNIGEMVSLGSSKAVARIYGFRLYGFPVRLILLVAYSLLVTGMYNRIRIVIDWLLSLVFGRDTTFIKLEE
ncbi:FAD-dependent oxidoreductase [Chloroflexota bacterium]